MDDLLDPPQSPKDSAGSHRHHLFYFEDSTVIFLVEDKLFGLHRSTFQRHSPIFRQMWTLPIPAGGQGEGTSDQLPIRLEGVTVQDFERLLYVLYPPKYGAYSLVTLSEWQSVIDLAAQWEFEDIRTLALREIQKLELTPAEKISLSHRYDIRHDWRLPSLIYLCERPDPPSIGDAQILGLENVLLLAKARERLKSAHGSADFDCYNCRAGDSFELACKTCGVGLETFVTRSELPDSSRIIMDVFNIH